jgi:predicted transcriptional regulator
VYSRHRWRSAVAAAREAIDAVAADERHLTQVDDGLRDANFGRLVERLPETAARGDVDLPATRTVIRSIPS